jgi:hypothetical protein
MTDADDAADTGDSGDGGGVVDRAKSAGMEVLGTVVDAVLDAL